MERKHVLKVLCYIEQAHDQMRKINEHEEIVEAYALLESAHKIVYAILEKE